MSSSLRQYIRSGEFYVWITAGALALSLVLLSGLLLLIAINGFAGFWPGEIRELTLHDGSKVLGEIQEIDVDNERLKIKQGNRDLYGLDFRWIELKDIKRQSVPLDAIHIDYPLHWTSVFEILNLSVLRRPIDFELSQNQN